MKPFHRLIFILSCLSLFTSACDQASNSNTETQPAKTPVTEPAPDAGKRRAAPEESQRTRGLAPAEEDYDFAGEYPSLYALVRENMSLLEVLTPYARLVSKVDQIQSEESLISVIEQRDKLILNRLTPIFEGGHEEEIEGNFDALELELNRLGLTQLMAEGMVLGLGPAPMLEGKVEELGSPDFKAFLSFTYADSRSHNGEYPFMNMEPFEEMVLAGETLKNNQPNPYWEKVKERFEQALEVVTDIHLVRMPGARQDGGSPMVGGIHTDYYPYAAETESLKEFATRHPNSNYAGAIARIAQNPSIMSQSPEALYIIVLEWKEEEEIARQRVQTYLAAGEDIPHYLPVNQADGRLRYAVSYRFYEEDTKADQALETIQKSHPEAQLIYCSVRGGQLYQMGPSAD